MIKQVYDDIILSLKEGNRPRIQATEVLLEALTSGLSDENEDLDKCICIACHLARPEKKLQLPLIQLLKGNTPAETQVFVLEAIARHILDERMVSGDRLTPEFLSTFGTFLKSAPKNTLPFAIGIIEGCGSQGIYFRKILKDLKWSFIDVFKKDSREVISRIEALEKHWQKLDK